MNPTVFWINLRFILLSCFLSRVFLRAPGVRRSPDWMICSTGVRFQSCAPALFLDARMHAHARTPRVHELFLFLSWFDPDSMSSVALFDFSFSTLSGFQPNSSFCWTFHSIHFIWSLINCYPATVDFIFKVFWWGKKTPTQTFPSQLSLEATELWKHVGVFEVLRSSSLHLLKALIRDRSRLLKPSEHHGNQPYTGTDCSNKSIWWPETWD